MCLHSTYMGAPEFIYNTCVGLSGSLWIGLHRHAPQKRMLMLPGSPGSLHVNRIRPKAKPLQSADGLLRSMGAGPATGAAGPCSLGMSSFHDI